MPDDKLDIENVMETPIERAGRLEADENQEALSIDRDEHEANVLIKDIDEYIAETDSSLLPDAEKELDEWEIPVDPLDDSGITLTEGALVPVYTAQSEAEANIIAGVLRSAGIPCVFDNCAGHPLGAAISSAPDHWGDVVTPETFAEIAKQTIAESVTLENVSE